MSHDHTGEPARAVSQLTESLTASWAQAAHSQRALLQEMSSFAKDESLRFFNLRLERNGAALDKMQTCTGIPGLIGVQQEWLRDFVQDVIGQNMRVAGALRGVTHDAMASAVEATRHTMDQAQDIARQAEDQFHDMEAHNHLADDEQGFTADVHH